MLPEFALSRVYLLVISRLMSAYDFYSQRVNNDLFIKRTELKDKHIFIFSQRKTTRSQAASQFETCTEMASL